MRILSCERASCYPVAAMSFSAAVTARLPRIPRSSRLPLLSNKQYKLEYCFKPRVNEGAKSETSTVELSFQTPVSKKYICTLCRYLLRDPVQVTCCSSYYCRECINSLSATSGKCAFKDCGKNYAIITDGPAVEEIAKKVRQLMVYCFLRESGCKWVGTVEQLEQEHYTSMDYSKQDTVACEYQEVKCPNKCGVSVPRGNVIEHRFSDCENEVSECEFCGLEDNSHVIYKVHQKVCPSAPVECPNKCGTPGTARCKILVHCENECPLRLVACSYRHVGCEEQVQYKNLDEHDTVSYQKHLDLMSEKLVFVINVNDELRGEKDQLQNDVDMFVSKLRDLQAGIGSLEAILEYYEAIQNDSYECFPSSVSSSSINTVIVESAEGDDSESGYNSVIYESMSTGNPENSEGQYVNVRAGLQNRPSTKVLPEMCPEVPRPRNPYENMSTFPRGRHSVPTMGNNLLGVRKAARSNSLPGGSNPELAGQHLAQDNGEMTLSSISENGSAGGVRPRNRGTDETGGGATAAPGQIDSTTCRPRGQDTNRTGSTSPHGRGDSSADRALSYPQSHSSSYALPIGRPKNRTVTSSNYNQRISEAVRPRNPSSSSGSRSPPPLPLRTSSKNETTTSIPDHPNELKPFPFPSDSRIEPIPVLPPTIGSLSSNVGPTSSIVSPLSPRREIAGSMESLSTSPPKKKPLPPPRNRLSSIGGKSHLRARSTASLPEVDLDELKAAVKRMSTIN